MKSKYLQIRISERRLNKFRLYAAQKDKTMTAIIEDFIDSLKLENGDSSSTIRPVKPAV
ncbi:hypothetical protein G7B40_002865 [Aetokthonos hydrillicola Thurmond2011]|jgi:hypothetical protein|uniref:Uncharacterized protein n=1 Tax=Aetokthonos hydrillicola Thurmond2011 TaxID=2712845 RepID=A0AAP5I2K3_9CYAN|nr:hypothetical protein [Aetokthonos hydrillicola]MDR9893530.1 hypothetical protein [Aetokthonos hydrillicola Thurmond2011]